jgi:tellurite resistance protein TerC
VLIYGVLGAIVMRTGMIFRRAWLISQFHWVLYLFGAFLLITGVKMMWFAGHEPTWRTTRCCAGCGGT